MGAKNVGMNNCSATPHELCKNIDGLYDNHDSLFDPSR